MIMLARMVDADNVEGSVIWGRIIKTVIKLQDTDVGAVH